MLCVPSDQPRGPGVAKVKTEGKVYQPVEHVTVWVDGGIMLKTSEPFGDPVEMTEVDAEELGQLLLALAKAEREGSPAPD
jgi:hypothetical protein